ncbi:unnamed protein product [Candidula unifasciata]|uniref:G-protein coupled receptors family 1 profile domain-containing protein n=1 Tax=Candidula unifasciata TaxID=100452 RepID=A0A8S3YIZ2_9EUPU|nr:unnamed protein product [Candidula unifasciata]
MAQLTNDDVSMSTQNTVTNSLGSSDIYLSELTREIIIGVVYVVINPLFSVFGIITNLINITVFIKCGFSDSVNIALLGLSLSDLFLLLFILWRSICFFPLFRQADLPFDPLETAYVTAGIPLTYFGRTTSWITAFITLERFLCVAFPLKVKTLSTPRKSTIIVICIYVLMAATVASLFYTSRVGMKFFPERNSSRLGLVFTSDRYSVAKYANPFSNLVVQIGSFLFVLVFTVLLFDKLKSNNKWRQNVTDQASLLSRRDQKVAIMIVLVSSNFIICYVGITIEYIWPIFNPEFTSGLAYRNTLFVVTAFAITTHQINAATNLFIYLTMSSKYRRVFHSVFLCVTVKAGTSA